MSDRDFTVRIGSSLSSVLSVSRRPTLHEYFNVPIRGATVRERGTLPTLHKHSLVPIRAATVRESCKKLRETPH
jgi:hypothetical protein